MENLWMGESAQAPLRLMLAVSLTRGSESASHPMPAYCIWLRTSGVLPIWKRVMLISDLLHKDDYNHPKRVWHSFVYEVL